jgi:hypothetical protein
VTTPLARRALFLGGLAAVAALPLLGRALRAGGTERCALDGVRIGGPTVVRVVDATGRLRSLCCVDCAARWLRTLDGPPREVRVIDEATGAEVPEREAWFVESRILSFPVCASRVHVFSREEDARRHAADFRGRILEGERRPLRWTAGGAR